MAYLPSELGDFIQVNPVTDDSVQEIGGIKPLVYLRVGMIDVAMDMDGRHTHVRFPQGHFTLDQAYTAFRDQLMRRSPAGSFLEVDLINKEDQISKALLNRAKIVGVMQLDGEDVRLVLTNGGFADVRYEMGLALQIVSNCGA